MYKTGRLQAPASQMRRAFNLLKAHHSWDPQWTAVTATMSDSWRCVNCMKICGKTRQFCGVCGKSWHICADPIFQPRQGRQAGQRTHGTTRPTGLLSMVPNPNGQPLRSERHLHADGRPDVAASPTRRCALAKEKPKVMVQRQQWNHQPWHPFQRTRHGRNRHHPLGQLQRRHNLRKKTSS